MDAASRHGHLVELSLTQLRSKAGQKASPGGGLGIPWTQGQGSEDGGREVDGVCKVRAEQRQVYDSQKENVHPMLKVTKVVLEEYLSTRPLEAQPHMIECSSNMFKLGCWPVACHASMQV
jgi:hypothetical protein